MKQHMQKLYPGRVCTTSIFFHPYRNTNEALNQGAINLYSLFIGISSIQAMKVNNLVSNLLKNSNLDQ